MLNMKISYECGEEQRGKSKIVKAFLILEFYYNQNL